MCGILGIVCADRTTLPCSDSEFEHALDLMAHRGPDARRVQRFGNTALLGHVRLSIIDPAPESHQPFGFANRYWVVFNGEIFNFVELRAELQALGAAFRTHSDTEVLIQAYAHWGANCVKRFNGMWAFAIYDNENRSLFCSRDRFGEKPFNYCFEQGRFAFASEIKSLLPLFPHLASPNLTAIANYCRASVGAQHPNTWFKGVMRLQPGHNLFVENGKLRHERYWHYPESTDNRLSFADAVAEYRHRFSQAVALRLRSDVPFGLTLSSGVDSMSIAHEMHERTHKALNCYTARFDRNEYLPAELSVFAQQAFIDEAATVKTVADRIGLKANFIDVNYDSFVSSLAEAIHHLESGNSSPAVLPMLQVMRRARRDVTVVLEGQGADELMGGYIVASFMALVVEQLAAGRFREARRSIAEFKSKYALKPAVMLALHQKSDRLPFVSRLYRTRTGANQVLGPLLDQQANLNDYPDLGREGISGPLATLLRQQHSGGLVNLLHYGDAISMAASVETRNPFLDHELVEFVWRLPSHYKIAGSEGKVIHRQAMRGVLPNTILDQVKIGYATPISRRFLADAGGAAESPIDVLMSDQCLARGLFERKPLERLIAAHQQGRHDHGYFLFRLLSTELWFRRFIDQRRPQGMSGHQTAC
ncbi:MAG TPA: asparagine synthase (glutamine-hydrolyzing) [Aestuariivirga sp.]|nr:asparagine synthase (glutamine-hydrolyzing) [Aestuariivirga sp.]